MENCTIYSHNLRFDNIVNTVKTLLPKAKVEVNDGGKQKSLKAIIKGGFFGKSKSLTINYRERENPSYTLDQIECGLTQNLAGMANFIQAIPTQHEEIKGKFLYKVMSANCEMAFMAEPNINADFEKVLRQICEELDAFIFAQPGGIFQSSATQHFVDKSFNLILDTNGESSVNDVSVVVDAKYKDIPQENWTEEQINRKSRSEENLASNNIKVNKNLPCIEAESNVTLRTKDKVIDRAYALLIVAAKGEGISKEQLNKPIQEKNISSFSPHEQIILDTEELNDQQIAYSTWRYESLNTLLWALGYNETLAYPSEMCDVPTIVGGLLKTTREAFTAQCSLRSTAEILDELDKTYRMNWTCVDARINGTPVGGNINPSIIYERHYALNWLTSYQDQAWDDVQTDT